MKKSVLRIGRTIPVWLLILALVVTGAGAAAGTILAGKVTGVMPVAASQALLVGQPLNDIPYTPDYALWDVDPFTSENPTGTPWPPFGFDITNLSNLVSSDDTWEITPGVFGPLFPAQQVYKFFVGSELGISQIVVTYEGHVFDPLAMVPGSLEVWDDLAGAWDTVLMAALIPLGPPDNTLTITLTGSSLVTVANAVDSNGYLYVQAYAPLPLGLGGLFTDQVYVTATYTDMPQQVYDNVDMLATANRFVGVRKDDNTAFQAAMELATGDWTEIQLPIKNASENNLVARMTLDVPSGLEVEVWASNGSDSQVTNVVREGMNTWKFIVEAGADYATLTDLLHIVVSVDDDTPPGYYTISGTIKQIAY